MDAIYDWVREWGARLGAMTKTLAAALAVAGVAGCASSNPWVSCLPQWNYQECVDAAFSSGSSPAPAARQSMSADDMILLGTVLSGGRGYQPAPPLPAPGLPAYDYAAEEARRQEQYRRQQEYERQLQWQRQQEQQYQYDQLKPGMRETYGP